MATTSCLLGLSTLNEEVAMAKQKSIKVRQSLATLFSPQRIMHFARSTGAVVRNRKVSITHLFWTVVLGFGTGRTRQIAGLRRSYEKSTGQTIEESSFYDRFTPAFTRMLKAAVAHAIGSLNGVGRALAGPLAAFKDVLLTDSTVMRLHDLLEKAFPACRTNHTLAALKMHVVLSVAGAGKQSIRLTAQRRHDRRVFTVGPWVRDRLLIFDLGYFCYRLFACIVRNGGYFLSRLKDSANPRIVAVNRACRGRARGLIGRRLRDMLPHLTRGILDVMVEVSFRRRTYGGHRHGGTQLLRVVGMRDAETGEYHLYITNIPVEKLAAEDIQHVYAARWLIELLFNELKSTYRIEDLPSRKRHIVEALVHAAILTLIVSRTLLNDLRGILQDMTERMPLKRWATVFAAVAADVLRLLTRPPRETRALERDVSRYLLHEVVDPNASRLSLIQSVEMRCHQYQKAAV
jgi:IS4 transposase